MRPIIIVLSVDSAVVKPNGEVFKIKANGSDAALILAKVVDANGIWCPNAAGLITWSVSGPGSYRGGTDQYVDATKGKHWHSPMDPELSIEGGMAKVAVRSMFKQGVVTVSATSPNLKAGSTSFFVYNLDGTTSVAPQGALTARGMQTAADLKTYGAGVKFFIAQPSSVGFDVLNANGKVVERIPASLQASGWHPVRFAGASGLKCNGVYFVRMYLDGKSFGVKKVFLIR